VRLDRGTVVLLDLDPTIGHEQRGVVRLECRDVRGDGGATCAPRAAGARAGFLVRVT